MLNSLPDKWFDNWTSIYYSSREPPIPSPKASWTRKLKQFCDEVVRAVRC